MDEHFNMWRSTAYDAEQLWYLPAARTITKADF